MDMWKKILGLRHFRRTKIVALTIVLLGSVAALIVPAAIAGKSRTVPEVVQHALPPSVVIQGEPREDGILRVLTLNLAHGRGSGRHQMLQPTKRIRSHLDVTARLLARVRPDVVALQEADGPAFWSGRFSHVEYLAREAGFEFSCHGFHVKCGKTAYGTALLSTDRLEDPLSITFDPTPPTLSKGFLVGAIRWPGQPDLLVDVITVHLDFARRSARREQVERMVAELKPRRRPRIILGDFNCDWKRENSALRHLARELDLEAHRPESPDLVTFPKLDRRLDWILISREFRFVKHEVLPDAVSDHRAVVAEIALRDPESEALRLRSSAPPATRERPGLADRARTPADG